LAWILKRFGGDGILGDIGMSPIGVSKKLGVCFGDIGDNIYGSFRLPDWTTWRPSE